MAELMKKAIAKIDAEGEKGGSNQKRIAQYIIDDLITDDISAEKIKVIVNKRPGKTCKSGVDIKHAGEPTENGWRLYRNRHDIDGRRHYLQRRRQNVRTAAQLQTLRLRFCRNTHHCRHRQRRILQPVR